MKIAVVHGQSRSHKGSTYTVTHMLLDKLGKNKVKEFFLPDDFDDFCTGCFNCIVKGPEYCPHYKKLHPITKAIEEADLIVFASPTYAFHCSGQMKTLLDHLAYHWMSHRPMPLMFTKQGVAITTCTGAGRSTANFDMLNSLFFWGVGKRYAISSQLGSICWQKAWPKFVKKLEKKTTKVAHKIKKNFGKVKPSASQKAFFRWMKSYAGIFECDKQYWKDNWIKKPTPWSKEVQSKIKKSA